MAIDNKTLVAGAVAICVVGPAWRWDARRRGVEVIVHNSSGHSLRSIRVSVTGETAMINELPDGDTRAVWVAPRGDSGIDVSTARPNGVIETTNVAGYIEVGATGFVTVDIAPTEVQYTEHIFQVP